MNPILFEATVDVAGGLIIFSCLAHFTNDPKDRLIDSEFYEKFGQDIPVGGHFEMEVIIPATKPEGTHIHINPHTGRQFLCWTSRLATEADAWKIFLTWSVGTAYTLVSGKDFLPLAGRPTNEFLAFMDHDYRIKLSRTNKII